LKKKNVYTTDKKQPQEEQSDFYTNKFIGNFEIRRIFNESDSREQEMYHVTFKDGAMTKIHTHESEQILIATTNSSEHTPLRDVGKGFVVLIEKSIGSTTDTDTKFNINKPIFLDEIGDTVCIPSNILHCHGSRCKNQDFSHIAIRRSTLDNGQQAKSLWEYEIEEMKKVMGITDNSKVLSILNELNGKIKTIISE
jgi:hypothetical protein